MTAPFSVDREDSNRIIFEQLDARLLELESVLQADCLTLYGEMSFGLDDYVRDAVEWRQNKRKTLVVLLQTLGGYAEVVERIADTFRAHYDRVEFVIPNHALSAGTLLVMSGDAIHMDYYSILGPIDPQVQLASGDRLVPALGYLAEYDKLIAKSAMPPGLTTAELAYLIAKYDPADLYAFRQQGQLSITLLKRWLANYKFKNWDTTEERGITVTQEMREDRAKEIAEKLQDTERWHSHSRGLSMSVLRKELNLLIDDFGAEDDPKKVMKNGIKKYTRLLSDFMSRTQHGGVVHVPARYTPLPT